MIDIGKELAVQSYCFRGFKDNAKVADMVKECGLSRIELCGVHVNMSEPDTFESVVRTYRDAGVSIPSIGAVGIGNDADKARCPFEFAKAAGAGYIAVDFQVDTVPDCFELAARLSREYGIAVGIHNHGGRHWLGSAQMLEAVFGKAPAAVGLCLDTAWALDSHEDPIAMAKRFADRLRMVHLKDFVFDRAGKPEDVVVGTGNLDLPAFFGFLKEMPFEGCATLEYEGDVTDPVPALKKCVDAIRQEWQRA